MTDEEILEKAVRKAIAGGWKIEDFRYSGEMSVESVYYWFDDDHGDLSVNDLIWRHDFAKALWNAPKMLEMDFTQPSFETRDGRSEWQYHLQRMVISDNPIKYLGEHI